MTNATITTLLKMIESLPKDQQERVVEHLREYLADLEERNQWDRLFLKSQEDLSRLAKKVKQKVADGEAQDFDYERL